MSESGWSSRQGSWTECFAVSITSRQWQLWKSGSQCNFASVKKRKSFPQGENPTRPNRVQQRVAKRLEMAREMLLLGQTKWRATGHFGKYFGQRSFLGAPLHNWFVQDAHSGFSPDSPPPITKLCGLKGEGGVFPELPVRHPKSTLAAIGASILKGIRGWRHGR